MNIILYGTSEECRHIREMCETQTFLAFRNVEYIEKNDYESYVHALTEEELAGVLVLADGANGMEGVIASKELRLQVPVVWFSDDKGFGSQSYRLNATYFHAKPVTPELLEIALNKCIFAQAFHRPKQMCKGETLQLKQYK